MTLQDLSLVRRPGELSFTWNQLFNHTFRWMKTVDQLWAEWLKDNVPTDVQVLRKLLLDLLPPGINEEFSTLGGWAR